MPIRGSQVVFEHQAHATLSQANPVVNNWYTVLNTTSNVRLYAICCRVADTAETLQVRLTIDGQTLTDSFEATADTTYYNYLRFTDADLWFQTTTYLVGVYTYIEGRSVKVEVRKVTNAGAGTITGRVVYARLS